jgi:hypothetical protein
MKAICALAAGGYLILAVTAGSLALDWATIGEGIHPALALPVALLSAIAAYLTASIGDAMP